MGERVRVASLAEVPPGTGRQVQVSGRALAIYNLDGIVHAIDGTCTHRGGPLGEGELAGNVVTCPGTGHASTSRLERYWVRRPRRE